MSDPLRAQSRPHRPLAAFEAGIIEDHAVLPSDNGERSRTIADLISVGAVNTLSSEEGVVPVSIMKALAIGNMTVLVTFASKTLHQAMIAAFAHLQVPPQASNEQISVFQKDGLTGIARRNGPVNGAGANEAVPVLKIVLTESALDRVGGLALHCATLLRGNRAVLLFGGPGAGKSTRPSGCTLPASPWPGTILPNFFDGTVRARRFAVTLMPGSWKLFRRTRRDLDSVQTFHRPDGRKAGYLPIDAAAAATALQTSWIVVFDRRVEATPALSPLSPAGTFALMFKSAWSGETDLTPDQFEGLAACINRAHCMRFTYSDLATAVDTFTRFCDDEER